MGRTDPRASPPVLVSIVSHGHRRHVERLLADLSKSGNAEFIRVILTFNVPEDFEIGSLDLPYPLEIRRNETPLGFSSNHNQVFFEQGHDRAQAEYFCVLNPDIGLPAGTFANLLKYVGDSQPELALVAPAVISAKGEIEDSARKVPTPTIILSKAIHLLFGMSRRAHVIPKNPDWVAGMFMLFRAEAFENIGGFDERYHLYYEDVDICCRLRASGYGLRYCPEVKIIHDAQRSSHRELRYLAWHAISMLRFFFSPASRQCRHQP